MLSCGPTWSLGPGQSRSESPSQWHRSEPALALAGKPASAGARVPAAVPFQVGVLKEGLLGNFENGPGPGPPVPNSNEWIIRAIYWVLESTQKPALDRGSNHRTGP